MQDPFWKTKTLAQMTRPEWESLCDGCGRCCLHKLRHVDTDELSFTNVACRLLDTESCRCSDYAGRKRRVPDCVKLTAASLPKIDWLPPSCAYRRVAEGKDLAWWHPLVSGDPQTVHLAGVSVRGRAISERHAGELEGHIVAWPGRMPRPPAPAGDRRRAVRRYDGVIHIFATYRRGWRRGSGQGFLVRPLAGRAAAEGFPV